MISNRLGSTVKDAREKIDIVLLNVQLKTAMARVTWLCAEIDAIVADIAGEQA